MSDLDKISSLFNAKIDSVKSKEELQNIKTEFFGKNGQITTQFKNLGTLESNKRKEFASNLNKIKDDLSNQLERKNLEIETSEINEKLKNEKVDVTLPIRPYRKGKIHPVSQVIDEISSIFSEIGFSVAEGPDVENEYNNFTALNTPEDHPAREMQDTFYLNEKDELDKPFVLRTHTSPVQIRTMMNAKPPIKIIAPGRTYRCDSDSTHSPMFHQVEGLYIDKDVSFADLKQTLLTFSKSFFGEETEIRLRPSYFPFTEPSAEMDIWWGLETEIDHRMTKGTGWLEIMGCGMVDPAVLDSCGIDSKQYTGFAFGMGIERIAMQRFQIPDIRAFYENDLRFLANFKGA